MSTLVANTIQAPILTSVSTIRDSGGTARLTVNTSDPVLVVGNGSEIIKARNTAKWWVTAANIATIQASYGVASLTDVGSNTVRITASTPTTNVRYCIGCSLDHASALSWASQMNYTSPGNTTTQDFRFHYNDSGAGFTPRGWSAVAFGDQA
jgi:hypothetical protein